VTCIDTRIEPLAMLGLQPGDAKIIRVVGARVTREVLDTLAVAHHLLAVERVLVVAHTNCAMAGGSESELHEAIRAAGGPDTRSLALPVVEDQEEALRTDVERIRASPYLAGIGAAGALYDVDTGRVTLVC
jgi:carbonic anhydrase